MSDEAKPYQPVPFEQRPSQTLGAWDYLRKRGFIFILPFLVGGAGWAVGKTIKAERNLPALPENASFLQQFTHGVKLKAAMEGDYGSALLGRGLALGGFITAFLAWRQEEKKRLEVGDVVASVKDVANLHRSNEDIEKDNALVKKMIAFEREKQARLGAQDAPHQARISEQEAAPAAEISR